MFGTSGIRGPFGTDVTAQLALDVGHALTTAGYTTVVVGRDPRTTGPLLRDALAAGLREGGGDVIEIGVAATPTIARSVAWRDADAGVAVTASHNPPADNGLKFWTPSGMAFDTARRDELTAVLEAADFSAAAWDAVGTTRTWGDADAHHRAAIKEAVEPLDDVAVIVDVGNGAGSVTADALRALGCSVETLNDRPDGRFPSRPSEPTEAACQTLQATVAATDADLGVAHDGDADRMLAVDETGAFVGGDTLLALFGRATATPGDRIAAPVNTSRMVDTALADVGADVVRTRVGDVFVAEQARDDGVVFGGEPSGAWIWPSETLAPDGVLAAARLAALIDTDGPLSTQVATLEQYPIRRAHIETQNKQAVMKTVTETILDRYDEEAVQQLDGVRIEEPQGWILIRASGTQPLVRVTAEGTTDEEADELCSEARALVEAAL